MVGEFGKFDADFGSEKRSDEVQPAENNQEALEAAGVIYSTALGYKYGKYSSKLLEVGFGYDSTSVEKIDEDLEGRYRDITNAIPINHDGSAQNKILEHLNFELFNDNASKENELKEQAEEKSRLRKESGEIIGVKAAMFDPNEEERLKKSREEDVERLEKAVGKLYDRQYENQLSIGRLMEGAGLASFISGWQKLRHYEGLTEDQKDKLPAVINLEDLVTQTNFDQKDGHSKEVEQLLRLAVLDLTSDKKRETLVKGKEKEFVQDEGMDKAYVNKLAKKWKNHIRSIEKSDFLRDGERVVEILTQKISKVILVLTERKAKIKGEKNKTQIIVKREWKAIDAEALKNSEK